MYNTLHKNYQWRGNWWDQSAACGPIVKNRRDEVL